MENGGHFLEFGKQINLYGNVATVPYLKLFIRLVVYHIPSAEDKRIDQENGECIKIDPSFQREYFVDVTMGQSHFV